MEARFLGYIRPARRHDTVGATGIIVDYGKFTSTGDSRLISMIKAIVGTPRFGHLYLAPEKWKSMELSKENHNEPGCYQGNF
jgi:hypothetical protein